MAPLWRSPVSVLPFCLLETQRVVTVTSTRSSRGQAYCRRTGLGHRCDRFSPGRVMSQRSKVLQLQPDYNVKAHDFADLAEQIVKALPSDRYEVTAAFLRGNAGPGAPVSRP